MNIQTALTDMHPDLFHASLHVRIITELTRSIWIFFFKIRLIILIKVVEVDGRWFDLLAGCLSGCCTAMVATFGLDVMPTASCPVR